MGVGKRGNRTWGVAWVWANGGNVRGVLHGCGQTGETLAFSIATLSYCVAKHATKLSSNYYLMEDRRRDNNVIVLSKGGGGSGGGGVHLCM